MTCTGKAQPFVRSAKHQRNDIHFIHSIKSNFLILYHDIEFVFMLWQLVRCYVVYNSIVSKRYMTVPSLTWYHYLYPLPVKLPLFRQISVYDLVEHVICKDTICADNTSLSSLMICLSFWHSTWDMFKVRCQICSKLIKTPKRGYWHRSGVFVVTFNHFEQVNDGWEFVSFEW